MVDSLPVELFPLMGNKLVYTDFSSWRCTNKYFAQLLSSPELIIKIINGINCHLYQNIITRPRQSLLSLHQSISNYHIVEIDDPNQDIICRDNIISVSCNAGSTILVTTEGSVCVIGYFLFNQRISCEFTSKNNYEWVLNNHSNIILASTNYDGSILVLINIEEEILIYGFHPSPIKITHNETIRMITCGYEHVIIITNSGRGYIWKANFSLLLPLEGLGTSLIKQVACGKYHTAIVTTDGNLYTMGKNDQGQLGLGKQVDRSLKPTQIQNFGDQDPVIEIACHLWSTIILTKSGHIYSTGCLPGEGKPFFVFHRIDNLPIANHIAIICDKLFFSTKENEIYQIPPMGKSISLNFQPSQSIYKLIGGGDNQLIIVY